MGRWTDVAPWGGPSPNQGGAAREQRGVVLHIAEGSYNGTVAWCMNPASDISAHFVAAKDGRAVQLVDTDRTAWTQSAGNGRWLSIEFEGRAGDALTGAQLEFAARVLAQAHRASGVPLALADSPSGRGLGWHGMGGDSWGGHYGCPGAPIVAQRPAIVARAQQIINGGDMALTGDELKQIVQNVTCALARGTWRDGYTAQTFDQAYRGTTTLPVPTLVEIRSAVAEVAARPAATVTDAQVVALADRVGAVLTARIQATVEDAVRKVLGSLDGVTPKN